MRLDSISGQRLYLAEQKKLIHKHMGMGPPGLPAKRRDCPNFNLYICQRRVLVPPDTFQTRPLLCFQVKENYHDVEQSTVDETVSADSFYEKNLGAHCEGHYGIRCIQN